MVRAVPEWIGATPDQAIPPRVRLRIFQRHDGNCASCTRPLFPGHWQCDHIIALANGGEHRETNLRPLCTSPCHQTKTKADLAEKSTVYRKRTKHIGIKKPSKFACSRNSRWKKKISGEVVPRC